MPLTLFFVSRLDEVLDPVLEFLRRDRDLFSRPRIVVPTAGAKAWLQDRLTRQLGTGGRNDGIVANVEIGFPGLITTLLQPPRRLRANDPWSIDRLTFAVLDVLRGPQAATFGIPRDVSREPLLTARRIAALFDSYHVRRPAMILEWDRPGGNPVLTPTTGDEQVDGHPVPAALREGDRWQFDVWRAVRTRIDEPPPPARRTTTHLAGRDPLLVVGLQSLSLPQLECLEQLGNAVAVEAFLVHPSVGLRARWLASAKQPPPGSSPGFAPQKSRDPELPADADPLPSVWLGGARDLQDLAAARGIPVVDRCPATRTFSDTLLGRMQRTVWSGVEAAATDHDPSRDHSLLIHRCHSLSRQAEVVHEALLRAFAEIDGLQPQDVAIVSPCLQKAAPHLEAVFQRAVRGINTTGQPTTIRLPLVVADRGLRESSAVAELLVMLLALPGGRCSVDDVLGVAGHQLVRANFGVDDDTVSTWLDFAERTAIRWGLDEGHRRRQGLHLTASADVHTWRLGLERILLGATLPDAAARPELGGVVPLDDLDPADLQPAAALARILDVIHVLETASREPRTVADWCLSIEQALVGLCGERCPNMDEPLSHLRRLRSAAADTAAEAMPVPFEDVRQLLAGWFEEAPSRQSLRTGAIMATSMVPLRSVPFRVLCVVGYDDGAVGVSEADGDDLVARQQLLGDVDPRIDERRALLDCVLAAGDRLVIACNGRSVKTNQPLPLVTPLAELVDFAIRHGARRDEPHAPASIEIEHPRHHLSRRNFLADGLGLGGPWGHDAVAAAAAAVVGVAPVEAEPDGPIRGSSQAVPAAGHKPVVELQSLVRLVDDPLWLFLAQTLGIDTWRAGGERTPATLPLELEKRVIRDLATELLQVWCGDPEQVEAWRSAARSSGRLPLGPVGERQLGEIEELVAGIARKATADHVPLVGLPSLEVRIDVGNAHVVGHVPGVHEEGKQLVTIKMGPGDKKAFGRPLHVAAIHLAAAQAAGVGADRARVVARHEQWSPGALTRAGKLVEPCQIRTVGIDASVAPKERLALWCELALEALAERRGLFGLHDVAPESRAEAFERFVTGKSPATGESLYLKRPEAIAYGLAPLYPEIFRDDAPERLFLDRHTAAFRLESRGTSYTLR